MEKRSSLKINAAVLFALILREARARLYARRFGALWLLLEPIAHIAALLTVLIILRGRTIPGFDVPVFFLAGIVPFLIMRNICLRMMEAVSANQALFAYRQIKPLDTMVARLVVEVTLGLCVYVLVLLAMGLFLRYDISIHDPLEWLMIFLVGIALSFGIGIILCVVVEAFPEIKGFLRMLFLPLYLISGVIIPPWGRAGSFVDLVSWNPYLHIIDSLRGAVFEPYPETLVINMRYPVEVTICILFVALGLYRARRLRLVAI